MTTPNPLPNNPAPPMPMQPEGVSASSGNPVLDEISAAHASLSPQAQQAIEGAHGMLGISPAHSDPALAASAAPSPEVAASQSPFRSIGMVAGGPDQAGSLLANRPNPEVAVPGVSGPRGPLPDLSPETPVPGGDLPLLRSRDADTEPPVPGVSAPPPMPINPHQAEFERLTKPPLDPNDAGAHTSADTGRPGYEQIHNPWLRGLATAGNVIASGLFPRFGQFIPGTSGYHNNLVANEKGAIGEEQAGAKSAAQTDLEKAQAEEQRSLPELHKTQAELAAEKLSSTNTAKDADRAIKQADEERKRGESQQKISAGLAEHGLKLDPDTKELVALPYGEMSEPQKAAHDLKGAQAELLSARKDLVTAQKEGIPAAQELARKRVAAAQESAATAAGRLGLSRDEFNAQFLGTAPGGEPLAGGETDETGHPIGTKIAAANKPGATVQGRSAQAGSIIEAGNNLKAEIDKHKDKLGNLGGYWNQAVNGTPIADPDTARLMSEIASYAALQPAMHGMRGGQVMKEFEKMVGGVPKNPEALKAAIDGIASTASVMQHQGQPQHSGTGGSATQLDVKDPQKAATQYAALPVGAHFTTPDGKPGVKK